MDPQLLSQALQLTTWGMGVTFLTIGALVLGMYAMTAVFKDAPEKAEEAEIAPAAVPQSDERYLAAAAAVAVALAETHDRLYVASGALASSGWVDYSRSHALNQRMQHTFRRVRR